MTAFGQVEAHRSDVIGFSVAERVEDDRIELVDAEFVGGRDLLGPLDQGEFATLTDHEHWRHGCPAQHSSRVVEDSGAVKLVKVRRAGRDVIPVAALRDFVDRRAVTPAAPEAQPAPRRQSGPRTYTIARAAKEIGVTEKVVRQLIADRELVAFSRGGVELLFADIVHAYIDRRAAAAVRMDSGHEADAAATRLDEALNSGGAGRYRVAKGLYLHVTASGRRYWFMRYALGGRRRDMSLGPVTETNGLAAARAAAEKARALIAKGVDPLDQRRRLRDRQRPRAPTFAEAAKALIADFAPSWRGRNTRAAWERSLLTHAAAIGKRRVDEIDATHVLALLKPRWTRQPETAGKLRERIERVLDAQRAAGAIRGPWENPARWRGHLALMLPKRQRLSRGHHPAMPYADASAFLAEIRGQKSMGARALEFAILTACREGVVIAARWEEVSLDEAAPCWHIPAEKMKMERDLRVPLSPAATALLRRVPGQLLGRKGWVFPGKRYRGRQRPHISDMTMDAVLRRMALPYTVHGFRSTFRDWAGDCTEHPRELVEEALAHAVGNATERAYRRSDALAKRRVLMDDWAAYLAGVPSRLSIRCGPRGPSGRRSKHASSWDWPLPGPKTQICPCEGG